MRSSKNRSRSKANRQRSIGNIVNRVFDSSGPEGKVRGTPQQIIEKYLMLARDAQLGNDRVAEQNFLQHAEHYTRLLGEAQRELQREQEQRQVQQPQQPQQGGGGQYAGDNRYQNGGSAGQQVRYEPRVEREDEAPQPPYFEGVPRFDPPEDDGPGLVQTPEAAREPPQRAAEGEVSAEGRDRRPRNRPPRRPRGPREEGTSESGEVPREGVAAAPEDSGTPE
ncbi:MAG: DUF4167 domain-containing protein [Paracoccaceae bacterium]